jgi:photosystem II stability/assembly factor-like uncharacterized protein
MISLPKHAWIVAAGFLGCVACGGGGGDEGDGATDAIVRLAVGSHDVAEADGSGGTTSRIRIFRNVGAGWVPVDESLPTEWGVKKVVFASRDVAWAYEDRLLRSTDAGLTWEDVTATLPAELRTGEYRILSLAFADARTGYLGLYSQASPVGERVAGPFVWVTRDGGESWQRVDAVQARPLDTFFVLGVRSGVAELFRYAPAADGASIMEAIDGGTFPPQVVTPLSTWIDGALEAEGERGWAAGGVSTDGETIHPAIFTSVRPGATWSPQLLPDLGPSHLMVVDMCDARIGIAGGRQHGRPVPPLLLWTDDGGSSWEETALPALDPDYTFADATCVTASEVLVVAEDWGPRPTPRGSILYASRDGGRTFAPVADAFGDSRIYGIASNAEFQ